MNRRNRKALDRYAKRYCNAFEKLVENDKSLNMFKCLVALMRSGKTFWAIHHHIPYLLNDTDCKIAILTAPLSGIVLQNVKQLRAVCAKNGFFYCEKPSDVEFALANDMKAAIYMTNSKAWANQTTGKMFDRLIQDRVPIAPILDECWTWTISDKEVVEEISGNWGTPEGYKASWYNIMERIAEYSPYTYGMSATKTDQLNGTIPPTYGNMGYKIGIDFLNPKELSHRLAWMGDVTYFSESSLDVNMITPLEAVTKMAKTLFETEKYCSNVMKDEECTKRTALIQCQTKKGKYTVELLRKIIENVDYSGSNSDHISCVMTSEKTYTFNKLGEEIPTTEEEIYRKLDDEHDPLRFCLSIFMAKMGVTIRTWKEIMIFGMAIKQNKNGQIVYQKNQAMGRGLTPNSGMSLENYWIRGGTFEHCPDFPKELNTLNLYLYDTPTNVAAVEVFKRDFCPTYEDFVASIDQDCLECGAEPQHQKFHRKEDNSVEELFTQKEVDGNCENLLLN